MSNQDLIGKVFRDTHTYGKAIMVVVDLDNHFPDKHILVKPVDSFGISYWRNAEVVRRLIKESAATIDPNLCFLQAKSFEDRVFWAERLLQNFGDKTIARGADEIPSFTYMGQNITHECAMNGKNAIFQDGDMAGFGRVIRDQNGTYWNANFGRVCPVTPVFS